MDFFLYLTNLSVNINFNHFTLNLTISLRLFPINYFTKLLIELLGQGNMKKGSRQGESKVKPRSIEIDLVT